MTATKKAATSRKPAAKPRGTRKKAGKTAEEHYLAIQECAYLKAEADGFRKDPADYWLAAEAEIGS